MKNDSISAGWLCDPCGVTLLCRRRGFEHFRLWDEELGHASTTKVLAVLAERKTI